MLKNRWIRFSARNTSSQMEAEEYKYYDEIHPLSLNENLFDWAYEKIGQYKEYWQFVDQHWEEVDSLPKNVRDRLIQQYEADYDISSYMIRILKDTPYHD